MVTFLILVSLTQVGRGCLGQTLLRRRFLRILSKALAKHLVLQIVEIIALQGRGMAASLQLLRMMILLLLDSSLTNEANHLKVRVRLQLCGPDKVF